jgi:hypothetical protein
MDLQEVGGLERGVGTGWSCEYGKEPSGSIKLRGIS